MNYLFVHQNPKESAPNNTGGNFSSSLSYDDSKTYVVAMSNISGLFCILHFILGFSKPFLNCVRMRVFSLRAAIT